MQYSVRSMSGRPDNMALLAMATKDDLICANNYTYISLNSEKLILLERLEVQHYDFAILCAYMRLIFLDYLLTSSVASFPVAKCSYSHIFQQHRVYDGNLIIMQSSLDTDQSQIEWHGMLSSIQVSFVMVLIIL